MEIFDEDEALENTGRDRALLAEILYFTLEDMPPMINDLGDSLESGRFQEAVSLAHKAKGSAGTVGAAQLYMNLRELEDSLKSGKTEWRTQYQWIVDAFKEFQTHPDVKQLALLDHGA